MIKDAPKPHSAVPLRAYFVICMGILAVSTAAIFIRFAQDEGVPSLLIAASRLAIAAAVLTPITLRRYWQNVKMLARSDLLLAALSGFFLAIHFATWVTSLEYTSVLISVVLVATTPIWVALLEVFVLKTQLTRLIVAGLVVAIIGGLLIGLTGKSNLSGEHSDTTMIGGVLSLAGAITVSVYFIIGRKLRAGLPVIPYIWLVYGCAAIFLMLGVALSNIPVTDYPAQSYLWLLALGLIPQLIGHSSFNFALGYLPATVVSIATQVEPIVSAILAFVLFRETPAPLQLLGSLIIVAGVVMATLGQNQTRQA